MIETFGNGTVRSWASILDEATRVQAIETAALPILSAPLALMPDAHLGKGATIGTVLVTENAVIPMAVGVDIGCGMAARRTGVRLEDLPDLGPSTWVREMRARVPAGLGHWHGRAAARPGAASGGGRGEVSSHPLARGAGRLGPPRGRGVLPRLGTPLRRAL